MKKMTRKNMKLPYDLYEKQAAVAWALAHPVRIAILNVLREEPHCVQDITHYVRGKQSNISRHLGIMVAAGILTYQKQGLRVVYQVKTRCALRFFDCLSACLKEQIQNDRRVLKII